MHPTASFVHRYSFLSSKNSRALAAACMATAIAYFLLLAFYFPRGNPLLFWLLLIGEIFHLWQLGTYLYTTWQRPRPRPKLRPHYPAVDVFITVTGEPKDIVAATARAALRMDYPNFQVYLLNDGRVAKKSNWREAEELAAELGIACITRRRPGGAKAGNINHAMALTSRPLLAIFDADHAPHRDFLRKTAPLFSDPKLGFVQTPQFYRNADKNSATRGAWGQQEMFYGAICIGKDSLNSAFMCGTNMVISRKALLQIGGMYEKNIAEDFLTSLLLHERGWKSAYLPEVLAEGLAPEDLLSYCKQQFRWARGSLEVIFRFNPLWRPGLTWAQKIQYLASASYYLNGPVVLMNAVLPLFFFFTGQVPLLASTMGLTAAFLPYIFLVVLALKSTSNDSFTFRALGFSMASFAVHIQALWATLTFQKNGFSVTPKKQAAGNFLYLAAPQLAYLLLAAIGLQLAYLRNGLTPELLTNASWALLHASVFAPFIAAAMPQPASLSSWRENRARQSRLGSPKTAAPA